MFHANLLGYGNIAALLYGSVTFTASGPNDLRTVRDVTTISKPLKTPKLLYFGGNRAYQPPKFCPPWFLSPVPFW